MSGQFERRSRFPHISMPRIGDLRNLFDPSNGAKPTASVPPIRDYIVGGQQNDIADPAIQIMWDQYAGKYDRTLNLACIQEAWGVMEGAIPVLEGGVALDAGCGNGYMTRAIAIRSTPDTQIHAIDISDKMLSIAQKKLMENRPQDTGRIFFGKANLAEPLPFEDESIDLATSNFVFQYIDEKGQKVMLSELARITKPGGQLLLSTFLEGVDFSKVVKASIPSELRKNAIALLKALTVVPTTRKFDKYREEGKMHTPNLGELKEMCLTSSFSQFEVVADIFGGNGVVIRAIK